MASALAAAQAATRRPSVIWLPFQECTGCTESITRSHSPTLESLIFNVISIATFLIAVGLLMWALVLFLRETQAASAALRIPDEYLERDRRI